MKLRSLLTLTITAVLGNQGCGQSTGQGPDFPSYSQAAANARQYAGRRVEWTAKQVRFSTDMKQGRRVVTGRTFVVVDEQGRELWNQPFIVEGEARESDAVSKLGQSSNNENIWKVRGKIAGAGEFTLYVAGQRQEVTGPRVSDALLDVPAAASTGGQK